MTKVLLVDDENLLLESLEIILTMNGMEVVGKAADGKAALSLLEHTSCDVALVDLNMKGMGGIELIAHLRQRHPAVKILVLTTFYDETHITDAISGGADGYLLKDSGKDAILGAITQILGGVTVLDPKVMTKLISLISRTRADVKTEDITDREKEICALMVEGLTNRQIADRLFISEGTVKNYISKIYDKTGIHDRVKLILELKNQQ